MARPITIGVLALQGAFTEHTYLLNQAFLLLAVDKRNDEFTWECIEVRTPEQLARVDGLIIPGGESTTIALIAAQSGLLEPLREFVKVQRKNVWGTCAGMILLAEAANRTKINGQELIGGLDVRVNRNHFGRQTESFETDIQLPFLHDAESEAVAKDDRPFKGVFIRAPIVERILPLKEGIQVAEDDKPDTVVAPSRIALENVIPSAVNKQVEVLATLVMNRRQGSEMSGGVKAHIDGDIVAVKQGNVVATSFHPELTNDARMHVWWLGQVRAAILQRDNLRTSADTS